MVRPRRGNLLLTHVTHWNTLAGLMDFSVIEGLSEWPETQAELDRLLPLPSSLMRSLANLIRLLL